MLGLGTGVGVGEGVSVGEVTTEGVIDRGVGDRAGAGVRSGAAHAASMIVKKMMSTIRLDMAAILSYENKQSLVWI
jgi:hypothetical protein